MHGDDIACPSLGWQRVFLRARSDLAALRVQLAADRVVRLLNLDHRYREDQPRVPAGNGRISGQWTDGGGGVGDTSDGRVRVAQARRTATIRGRDYVVTSDAEETELILAAARAEAALNRVRELDPNWRAPPSLSDPQSARGAIDAYRALAQQAEARATVIERGGVPLGFASRKDFEALGRAAQYELGRAGYNDAYVYLRGSAVTGYSYESGEAFDVGEPSDFDLAIVSPTMMRRAEQAGVPLVRNRSRTFPLERDQERSLGISDFMTLMRNQSRRRTTIVIYRSKSVMDKRGPNIKLP